MSPTPHDLLRALHDAGVAAVAGAAATRRALETEDGLGARVALLAIGKAADAMALGALDHLGERLVDGLLVTKHGHLGERCRSDARLRCLESGHPVPDAASLAAGEAVLDFVGRVPDDAHLLVLLSGGGSALIEAPADGMDLDALRRRTDELLSGGLAIGEMNRRRRAFSRIKGGGLLERLGERRATQLLISDVPGDVLQDIASGPFLRADGTEDGRVRSRIVASNAIARAAVARAAEERGHRVLLADGSLDGDIGEVETRIADALMASGSGTAGRGADGPGADDPGAEPGVLIWGGEPTVVLPPDPGRGGRNQQLAAMLAARLDGIDGLAVSVCATDGTDGPTDAAGGIVDGTTCARASAAGLDLARAIATADAGPWLEACGALVRSGPTGTNVMDLAIGLRGGSRPGEG